MTCTCENNSSPKRQPTASTNSSFRHAIYLETVNETIKLNHFNEKKVTELSQAMSPTPPRPTNQYKWPSPTQFPRKLYILSLAWSCVSCHGKTKSLIMRPTNYIRISLNGSAGINLTFGPNHETGGVFFATLSWDLSFFFATKIWCVTFNEWILLVWLG